MIDPDAVGAVEREGIAAPDDLRIDVGDGQVADHDVAHAAAQNQAPLPCKVAPGPMPISVLWSRPKAV